MELEKTILIPFLLFKREDYDQNRSLTLSCGCDWNMQVKKRENIDILTPFLVIA
jgi:hypothetical protein